MSLTVIVLSTASIVTPKVVSQLYFVYFLSNYSNTTLYIGITSNIRKRVDQHKRKIVERFTEKYNLWKLIYYEIFDNPKTAIAREKQLKKWSRKKKDKLINKMNPERKELKP